MKVHTGLIMEYSASKENFLDRIKILQNRLITTKKELDTSN